MPGTRARFADRFWAKVARRGDDECWPWLGVCNNKGYGQIGRGGRGSGSMLSHRASWEIHYWPIPDGLCALHRCDNPPCCNPRHLFLGTKADNTADMMAKGRDGVTKFGPDIVAAVVASTEPAPLVSSRYGISETQVNRLRRANGATLPPKTHCKHGHALSGCNLIIRADGGRFCRECGRRRNAAFKKKSRNANHEVTL